MTEQEKRQADQLLGKIEIATGEIPDRSGPMAVLIADIVQAVNGLRSLLGVTRPH